MVACSQCGSENREEALFCHHCGQQVGAPTPPEFKEQFKPHVSDAEEDGFHQQENMPLPMGDIAEPLPSPEISEGEMDSLSPGSASANLDLRLSGAEPIEGFSLSAGALLQNRYRIVEILPQEGEPAIYITEDLLLCWNCANVQVSPDETYCENCGAAMDQKERVEIREVVLSSETPEIAEGVFEEGGSFYQLVPQEESPENDKSPAIQFAVGYRSDAGEVREVDEDSILILQLAALCKLRNKPLLGFFAVADGIGGHDAGEIASQAVVQSLAAGVMERIFAPEATGNALPLEELKNRLRKVILSANRAVLDIRAETEADMGSTLTAVLVRDTQAIIVNIGDSRTYLMRLGNLTQITEDHSMVAKMVAQGIIQPEEIYTHEQKGVIYRSLGDKPELELDDSIFELVLEPGDRLVLCCDGLWEMVRDEIIADTLLEYYDSQSACDRLVKLANLVGGDDNISVIVVEIRSQ